MSMFQIRYKSTICMGPRCLIYIYIYIYIYTYIYIYKCTYINKPYEDDALNPPAYGRAFRSVFCSMIDDPIKYPIKQQGVNMVKNPKLNGQWSIAQSQLPMAMSK